MNDRKEKRTTSDRPKAGSHSRRKGATGEREFINEVGERLGLHLTRNLDQWRSGGFDIEGLDHMAIEVKRYEKVAFHLVKEWWDQTIEQAIRHRRVPVLAYRGDHQPWRVRLPISFLRPDLPSLDIKYTIEVHMDLFCTLVRESLLEDDQSKGGHLEEALVDDEW